MSIGLARMVFPLLSHIQLCLKM
ncbi:hypothetical protein LINPERPRIM_LOCUS30045 [Linum perenne]